MLSAWHEKFSFFVCSLLLRWSLQNLILVLTSPLRSLLRSAPSPWQPGGLICSLLLDLLSGMSFHDLYIRCRESFLVNSDQTLRAQLVEFRDHKLIRAKKVCVGLYVGVCLWSSDTTGWSTYMPETEKVPQRLWSRWNVLYLWNTCTRRGESCVTQIRLCTFLLRYTSILDLLSATNWTNLKSGC